MELVSRLLHRPVFTYVQDDGTNINLDIQSLRSWCLAFAGDRLGPSLRRIPVDESVARHFVNDNIVSLDRVTELSRRPFALLDPSILCRHGFNPDGSERTMYADGHHRYVLAYMNRLKHVPVFLIEPPQWKPFVLDGLPDITQQELRDLPVTKRHY